MSEATETRSAGVDFRGLFRELRATLKASGPETQQSLQAVVALVASHFGSNVCSLYQFDEARENLFLRATKGLRPEAIGRTVLRLGEGLVGTIARIRQPLALEFAQEDERFIFHPETGEEIYQSFLGVPLIRAQTLLGVLVLQHREPRAYTPEEIEDCETVGQFLSEMLHQVTDEGVQREPAEPEGSLRLSALPLSAGLAVGKVKLHLKETVIRRWRTDDPAPEIVRLETALLQVEHALETLIARPETVADTEMTELLEADLMLARDKGWRERIVDAIEGGLTAEAAVQSEREELDARMKAISNDYIRARLQDLDDLSYRLLTTLSEEETPDVVSDLEPGTVLVCRSLGTSELLQAGHGRLAGLVVVDATPSSHLAIIASALNIPALGQAPEALTRLHDGDPIILDAINGQLIARPGPSVLANFETHIASRETARTETAASAGEPSVSRDGVAVTVMANAGLLLDLEEVDRSEAAGIGLYRTEMMFLIRSHLPSVEEQTQLYRRVFDRMGDRPVVFRTLDVGSDKKLAYLKEHEREANPALGWRAIRVSLDQPDLLCDQLRALLLAADGRTLRVMFPMISEAEEIAAARAMLDEVAAEHTARGGTPPERLEVGIMIEVPALLWDLDRVLAMVDFASVGTNDLFQFLYAADRTNPRTDNRFGVFKPANLRVLTAIARTAEKLGKPVSICGELAGSPLGMLMLLGCGFRTLSMSPAKIPDMKAAVRALDIRKVERHVRKLAKSAEGSVRKELAELARSFDL